MLDWAAIEAAPLVRFLATSPGAYPTLSALHVLGIALLMGPLALVDLRLLGLLPPALDAARPALTRAALIGFALATITGVGLASVQIQQYLDNPAFLAKLALLASAGVNAGLHHLRGGANGAPHAALSIALWLGVLFAGRWIAFVR